MICGEVQAGTAENNGDMGSDGRYNGMQGRTARFLDYLKAERRYSPLTVEAYRRDLAEFSAYVQEVFGDETWEEADRLRLRSYVAWLAERKIAPYSIRRKVSALRSFFRYEMKAGRLAANPALRLPMPKPGKRLVFFVEESGMARLDREEGGAVAAEGSGAGRIGSGQASGLAEISSGQPASGYLTSGQTLSSGQALGQPSGQTLSSGQTGMKGTKAGRKPKTKSPFETYRDYLILEMFYGTGMRSAELLSLQDGKVDARQAVVTVLGKRNKERQIPLHATLCGAIDVYRRLRTDEVGALTGGTFFVTLSGHPLSRSYVYRLVHTFLRKYTTIEKCSPHVLRHTFATHLLNEGADLNAVKMLLGHSSLASTQVYTHNTIEKLKKAYAAAHPKA